MATPALTPERRDAYWKRTSTLMWTILGLWFFFSFVVHLFAVQLNQIVIFGFPLSFWFAGQGSLAFFILLIVWYAVHMNKLDRKYGLQED